LVCVGSGVHFSFHFFTSLQALARPPGFEHEGFHFFEASLTGSAGALDSHTQIGFQFKRSN